MKNGESETSNGKTKRKAGPRTVNGKRRSAKNSCTHGLLSREFVFNTEEDRQEFQALRDELRNELNPSTPLLQFLFEDIVTGLWKSKLALRFELRELNRAAESGKGDTRADAPPETPAAPIYSDTAYRLSRKLQLVQELKNKLLADGHLTEQSKEMIVGQFGERFCALVNEWQPTQPVLLALLELMVYKAETFPGVELPRPPMTSEELSRTAERHNALEDPLRRQFLGKLFDLERMHLEQLLAWEIAGAAERRQSDPLERFIRYQTTIKRDLYRALDRYLEVQASLAG